MHTLIQLIKKCPPLLAVIQWLLRTAEQIHQLYLKLCWQIFVRLPLKERKVIFCNFYGGGFGDNPKFIAEEMIRRNLGFEMYWVCAHPEMVFPAPIRSVKPNSTAFAYHMATAKFLVENTRRQYYFIKRPGQFYIQTWHGGPGLKKVEMDVQAALSNEYIAYAKRDSACIDLFLSCCRWCSDLYHRAFWYSGPILERGIPKNDLYFTDHGEARRKIEEYYHIPAGKKIVLYAPTYRDNRATDMYNLDYDRVLAALENRFGGDWYCLIRLHPNLAAQAGIVPTGEKLRNATLYENMQELLVASDVIISDYSGCAFDYLVLKRPGFLYAEDYEEIKKVKDYYFTLEELPFSLAQSNDALIHNIETFDEAEYDKKCAAYVQRIQFFDDGHASEAAVDAMLAQLSPARDNR